MVLMMDRLNRAAGWRTRHIAIHRRLYRLLTDLTSTLISPLRRSYSRSSALMTIICSTTPTAGSASSQRSGRSSTNPTHQHKQRSVCVNQEAVNGDIVMMAWTTLEKEQTSPAQLFALALFQICANLTYKLVFFVDFLCIYLKHFHEMQWSRYGGLVSKVNRSS